ncbi:MAG: sialidase family protein [Verrucomicrobiota bacterium]
MKRNLTILLGLFLTLSLTTQLLAAGIGETVLNLEPTKENPRSSEGAFVTLKSGRVLFYYTQFYGGAHDNSPAHIVAIHSDDEGKTWSKEPQTIVENKGGENVMSVSLLRLKSGRIALFYLLKNNWLDCRPYVCFSEDETKTWSAPVLMTQAPGYFVMNNDRVIQLATGRLVAPLAFHRAKASDPKTSKSFDSRAITMWLLSDDEGKTWREADSWWAMPQNTRSGLQEPGVVELADGSLFSWARTDGGSQFIFRSKDQGKTWTPPAASTLASPVSPASIKRLPGSDKLLAIYNDHSGQFPFPKGKRTPLIAALSADGGATWTQAKALEEDPEGWYCYTAMHYTKDAVLLGYCAGDAKIGGLNRLRIKRVSLVDLQ